MTHIADKATFDIVRYGNCWEDAEVLVEALGERLHGGRVLSIASAGDNVLALLTRAPEQVVAVDLSLPQLACLELRMAGFRSLAHEELLAFLGITPCGHRLRTYRLLRGPLTGPARGFWDARTQVIEAGVIHHGKFEGYFRLFRQLLAFIHPRSRVERLLQSKDAEARRRFYAEQWNTCIWRLAAKLFFSRALMGRLGRDPSFFDQAEGSVAEQVLGRAERAVTTLATHDNPYLHHIMTGSFGECLPMYLCAEHFRQIRDGLDRVHIVHGDLRAGCGGRGFDAFNLSDIFEYMDAPTFETCARELAGAANDGAVLAYWNMMVPRSLPAVAPAHFQTRPALARSLHQRDKAFFYGAFHADRRCAA